VANIWRILGAVTILVVLLAAALWLAPAYVRHYRLQRAMDALVAEPGIAQRPLEVVQVAVAAKAASLGVGIRPEEVRVDMTSSRLRVEVRYIVRVDLPVYTVDLHFRAHSQAR
jgi:hypothetical protein